MRVIFFSALFLSGASGAALAEPAFRHAHAKIIVEANLKSVKRMTPELLKEFFKKKGDKVEDPAIVEKATAAGKLLYEGMEKVPEFQVYTHAVAQFEVAVFAGVKLDRYNAFFFGGNNNVGRCQIGNTLFISEDIVKLLDERELVFLMAHELFHVFKAHQCLLPDKRVAFYQGELIKVLADEKKIDDAGGEVAYLRQRFPELHEKGGILFPGTEAYENFYTRSNVYTSEVEAHVGAILLLKKLKLFDIAPVLDSFYKKMAVVRKEPLNCDGAPTEYRMSDYMASVQNKRISPEGSLHPPHCTTYLHLKAELVAHP